jgi:hypothetical protein
MAKWRNRNGVAKRRNEKHGEMKNHGGNNNHGMYNGEITTTSVGGVNGSGVSWRKANERKTMAIMKKKQGK